MSILIKGMEMPKKYPVTVTIFPDGVSVVKTISGKRFTATAAPVPPHGRLIDADALIADLKRQCREVFRIDAVSPNDFWINRNEAYNQRLWQTWCEGFYDYLGSRQTIIPAEEGER